MAFFTVNKDKDQVKDYTGGGGFLGSTSGIFEVVIKNAVVVNNGTGGEYVDLVVDYNGNESTIIRAFPLTNNDGSENSIGKDLFNKLAIVCELDGELHLEPKEFAYGIDKTVKEHYCIEELADCPVVLQIKRRFSWYEKKGEISMNVIVTNVFRTEDNASPGEIVNETEVGKQYEISLKYASKDKLDKGVTQEQVDEFLANRGKKSSEPKDNKPKQGFSTRFSKKSS